MRLIDKDELIAFIKANGFVYANTLETFPEIDAVPVVRCKDCQYWEYDHNYDSTIAFGYCRCRDWQTPWSESEIETVGMGYCHHGVRRED